MYTYHYEGLIFRLMMSFFLSLPFCTRGGVTYENLVGAPPVCTSSDFKPWLDLLIQKRIASIPLARSNTYHFSQDGDDAQGDGSIDNPWKSLSKAQEIIDGAPPQGGIRLNFRCGDTWREGVALNATIESQSGFQAQFSPKPQWQPQHKTVVLLQGETQNQEMEVRSYDPATGTITFNTLPLHANYKLLHLECALYIWKPNITVASYMDGALSRSPSKPQFSRFIPLNYLWESRGERQDSNVKTYSRSGLDDAVAWVKSGDQLDRHFRKVGSVSEVEANAGTWWWSANEKRLYAHAEYDIPMRGGQFRYEYVVTNRWNGIVVTDVDGVRLDNLITEGWGLGDYTPGGSEQTSYAGYGIISMTTGTNSILVNGCEAYYNNRHSMGNICDAGGIATYAHCSWGYCVEGGNGVSYAYQGGNEAIFYNCVTRTGDLLYGVQPFKNGQAKSVGYSHHCHTGGNGKYVSLFVSYKCRNVPGAGMSGHVGGSDMPPWSDLKDCRFFVVEDTWRTRTVSPLDCANPSSDNSNGILGPGITTGAYINCLLEHSLNYMSASENVAFIINQRNLKNTILLNCILTYTAWAERPYGSPIWHSWECDGLQAYNCQFDMTVNLTSAKCMFKFGDVGSTNVAFNVLKNCILGARGFDDSSTEGFVLRNDNTKDSLSNNGYYGVSIKEGVIGYNEDPFAVELPYWNPGDTPDTASPLISQSTQLVLNKYRLEYDFNWKTRGKRHSAIGPIEADLFLPLPSDILGLKLDAISGGDGNITLSFEAARDVSYTVQYTDELLSGPWLKLCDFEAGTADRTIVVNDSVNPLHKIRFYRVGATKTPSNKIGCP
jgi:hypothetical protein